MSPSMIYLMIFLSSFVIGSTFQSCANNDFLKPKSQGNRDLPDDHPSLDNWTQTSSSSLALMDRKGIESVLSNVFLGEGVSPGEESAFRNLFAQEVLIQQHTFGGACDLLETGDFLDCGYNHGNLAIPLRQSSSTVREASRIQLCRRILSRDGLLLPLLERQNWLTQPPQGENLQQAIQLFYPGWTQSLEAVEALSQLDHLMARNGEPLENRWRLVLNTLCESPFWEVL